MKGIVSRPSGYYDDDNSDEEEEDISDKNNKYLD